MKKSSLVLLIILVAAVSSAATVGVMKLSKNIGNPNKIIIITDKRCKECDAEKIEKSLANLLPEGQFEVLDYSDSKGKKLYKSEKLDKLPAILLSKKIESQPAYATLQKYIEPGDKYLKLKSGGQFDPEAEICDNEIDDNGNELIDCLDPSCKKDWRCMEKKEKPTVDVFVMSHCPFGTQIEKGILPVWDLLKDKIDVNIRFCDYAMHGKKEVDEQLKQYCIQKMDKEKFMKYLKCFLTDGKENNKCADSAKVDAAGLKKCISDSDKKFNIAKDFADKSKWKGRFPSFTVDSEFVEKFGVQGSPTLVINDVVVSSGRSPSALLEAICKAFKNKPEECKKELDKSNPKPGFGFEKSENGAPSNANCAS